MTYPVFAAVRIYAIYQKNIKFGMLVFVVYMVPVGLRIVSTNRTPNYIDIMTDGNAGSRSPPEALQHCL